MRWAGGGGGRTVAGGSVRPHRIRSASAPHPQRPPAKQRARLPIRHPAQQDGPGVMHGVTVVHAVHLRGGREAVGAGWVGGQQAAEQAGHHRPPTFPHPSSFSCLGGLEHGFRPNFGCPEHGGGVGGEERIARARAKNDDAPALEVAHRAPPDVGLRHLGNWARCALGRVGGGTGPMSEARPTNAPPQPCRARACRISIAVCTRVGTPSRSRAPWRSIAFMTVASIPREAWVGVCGPGGHAAPAAGRRAHARPSIQPQFFLPLFFFPTHPRSRPSLCPRRVTRRCRRRRGSSCRRPRRRRPAGKWGTGQRPGIGGAASQAAFWAVWGAARMLR